MQKRLLILLLICLVGWSGFAQKSRKNKVLPLELEFSTQGGFYADDIILEMRSPGARIYYTTDGSKPSRRSEVYNKPLILKSTTVIRAIARKGNRKSNIKGHTYFINEPETTFPVVSVLIPPYVLFDEEIGLFKEGYEADSTYSKAGANFWSRKEVRINYEFFEPDGTVGHRSNSGFRLFGGMSRLFPQKSFVLISRDRYGKKRVRHKVFGKDGLKKFKFLVMRNSGSDWGKSHFRDALMTDLVDGWGLEKQAYRPSHVYINGRYFGIYNIREKVNRYFIDHHTGVDKDSIDLIEHYLTVKRGNAIHYQKMLKFLKRNNLRHPEKFEYLNTQMDIQNFMDYKIAQIYFDNQDAGGNIKFWRPRTKTGRWRWILYDTDWGMGLHQEEAYKNNSLDFHTATNGPNWPNPPWSTFILRKLFENPDFQKNFVNRFCDYLNTSFEPGRVAAKIDRHYNTLLPEIDRHLDRWSLSRRKWEHEVEVMRTFANERPNYMRMHLMERFNTGAPIDIKVVASIGGQAIINDNVKVDQDTFRGKYFEHIPIQLKAIPNYGYRFSHWEGIPLGRKNHEVPLRLRKRKTYQIVAVFEKFDHPLADQIMINEISPNHKKAGDWVEIYNNSPETIDLHNWIFTDFKNTFQFPKVTLAPHKYLVLCRDSVAFRSVFPQDIPVVGNMNFGLKKKKERLGLYTDKGAAVDSMAYHIEPMDSVFVLSLLMPHLNNADYENWEILQGKGTPGVPNPFFMQAMIKDQQELYLKIGIAGGILIASMMVLGFRGRRRKAVPSD